MFAENVNLDPMLHTAIIMGMLALWTIAGALLVIAFRGK